MVTWRVWLTAAKAIYLNFRDGRLRVHSPPRPTWLVVQWITVGQLAFVHSSGPGLHHSPDPVKVDIWLSLSAPVTTSDTEIRGAL